MKIHFLENLLGCELEGILAEISEDTAALETFLSTLPTDSLENYLTPQWVVLAAGKGTRIDPTGRLSKTLDIMFGEENMLQRSRRYLPGTRPDIVVINPQMVSRIGESGSAAQLLGPNAVFCVQEEMNGTGGALQAALPALRESDAEIVGVSFGDEPFLERDIFAQTLLSHFISGADVTLCGKVPETVVDKGGLFFDAERKFNRNQRVVRHDGSREAGDVGSVAQRRGVHQHRYYAHSEKCFVRTDVSVATARKSKQRTPSGRSDTSLL